MSYLPFVGIVFHHITSNSYLDTFFFTNLTNLNTSDLELLILFHLLHLQGAEHNFFITYNGYHIQDEKFVR